MNCQEFETLSIDLTRERLMDADTRARGLAHADACARCAARLADQHALNAGLHAFAAAGAETEHAPAHLEEALLSAFRARGTDAPPASAINTHVFPASARRRWMRRAVGAASAVAAAVLVTFGIVAPRWQTNDAPSQEQQQQASEQSGNPQAASPVAPRSVAILVEPPPSNDNVSIQTGVALTATKNNLRRPVRRNVAESRDGVASRSARGGGAAENETAANRRASVAPSNAASSNVASATNEDAVEIATEFMPLVPGGTSASADGGQLVRVELPRSALVSMGLPLNVESSSERVKADVLLGEDGLARAIRFVR